MTSRAITCPVYEPIVGSRRCRHFIDNGGCAREDQFVCTEWLKANPGHGSATARTDAPATPTAPPTLTGCPPSEGPPQTARIVAARSLTADEVESFRALGVTVGLRIADDAEVWIVPEYTGAGRNEIRVDHAATLAALCSAFPGARISSFQKAGSR